MLYIPVGGIIEIVSIPTGAVVAALRGHTAAVTGVALHPTQPRQVVSCSLDGTVRTWDGDDGACLSTLALPWPAVRLAAAPLPPRCAWGARVFVVAFSLPGGGEGGEGKDEGGDDEEGGEEGEGEAGGDGGGDGSASRVAAAERYPLGEEPACLQAHPPGECLPRAVSARGQRLPPGTSRLVEVALGGGGAHRVLLRRRGVCTGFDARLLGGGAGGADVAVALAIRRSLYVYRAASGGERVTLHRHTTPLTTAALHPAEPLVTCGEEGGRLLTWHLPGELGAEGAPAGGGGGGSAPLQAARARGAAAAASAVHWHAHAPWAAAYAPDASYLLSGGEEATLVLWQLGRGEGGGGAPRKDKRAMAFIARLGERVTGIAAFSAGAAGAAGGGAEAGGGAPAAFGGGDDVHASTLRESVPLMFALTLAHNAVVLINGVTQAALWRRAFRAVAGLPAVLSGGALRFAARMSGGARRAAACGGAPPTLFSPPAPHSLRLAAARTLARGAVLDARARLVVTNGYPGAPALQWSDARSGVVAGELLVRPGANRVSRAERDPPPPVRVTHVAFSNDGHSMATVEAAPSADSARGPGEEDETPVLRFFARQAGAGASEWRPVTVVEAPHKARVTVLEFAPGSGGLLVTGSADRSFKLWTRAGGEAAGGEAGATPAPSVEEGGAAGAAAAAAGEAANRKARRAARAAGAGAPPAPPPSTATGAPPPPPPFTWICRSVGYWRDAPVTAGCFSGDASLLAVAYGGAVSLWAPANNALRAVLAFPRLAPAGAPPEVESVGFAGLSPLLVAAAAGHGVCVWDVLTCSLQWSARGERLLSPLAFERVGFTNTSTRFAFALGVPAPRAGGGVDAYAVVMDAGGGRGAPVALQRLAEGIPPPALPLSEDQAAPATLGFVVPPSLLRAAAFPYAVCFVPGAAAPPPAPAPPNELLVLDHRNEGTLVPLPPAAAAAAAAAAPAPPPPSQQQQQQLTAALQPTAAPAALAGALTSRRRGSAGGAPSPPPPPPRAPVPAATAALHAAVGVPGSALAALLADLLPPPPRAALEPAAGAKRARAESGAPPPPLPPPTAAPDAAAAGDKPSQLLATFGLSDAIAALLGQSGAAAGAVAVGAGVGGGGGGGEAAAASPPPDFLAVAWSSQ